MMKITHYWDGMDMMSLSKDELRQLRGHRISYVAQSAAASFNHALRIGKQVIEALAPLFLGHAQRQFLAIVKVFHGLDIFHVASLGSLAYR